MDLTGGLSAEELRLRFCARLKEVGELFERFPHGHRPTYRDLAKEVGNSKSTIEKWFKGQSFPNWDDLYVALDRIRVAALAAGMPPQDLALLNIGQWKQHHKEVLEQRAAEKKSVELGRQAVAQLETQEATARWLALSDPPKAVRAWKAVELNVHPAISGTPDTDPGFILPRYIRRPHDEQLERLLGSMVVEDQPALVAVRGGSCTGKTRAAFEALQAVKALADWHLAFPATAASALELLQASVLNHKAVLWLDDLHQLLVGDQGEALAAALRSRLNRPGPAILLATVWTTAHAELISLPPGSALGGDPHRNARALLSRARLIDVPPAFTSQDLHAADATKDASLAAAQLSAKDGKITQALAAGTQLLHRYTSAAQPPDCYSRALITAAMDATRMGYGSPLPTAFLSTAAAGYLDAEQRAAATDDQWLKGALELACKKVHRVASALEPVARPLGMGSIPDVWRLTDYLEEYGRSERRFMCPPASFWEAALSHLDHPDDLWNLSRAAHIRFRLRWADRLLHRAAETGSRRALREMLQRGEETGDRRVAETLVRRAADAGLPGGLLELASLLQQTGDRDGAEALVRQAVSADSIEALGQLALLREEAGDQDGATGLALRAAQAGDTIALRWLARLRRDGGDHASAEVLLREAIGIGDTEAMEQLSLQRADSGDQAGAEDLAWRAADGGNPDPLRRLALLREESGEHAAADVLARRAAQVGDTTALRTLAHIRRDGGEHAKAEKLLHEATQAGDTAALLDLAKWYEEAGKHKSAQALLRQAADAGNSSALGCLALQYEDAGDHTGAEALAWRAAEAGDSIHLMLVALRQGHTNRNKAETLLHRAADFGFVGFSFVLVRGFTTLKELLWPHGLEADGTPSRSRA
ncbi:tetratricopeptide repeat protein [Kitasatospora aureofaciens]|uniref:tetratricopeptide repeat protein n=1 Tax=Kitasatospora aureofaciens TaxID=1894 RepID=UPI0006924AF5|nr:transcriptional regulator [Kitasatospora aureofaciens]